MEENAGNVNDLFRTPLVSDVLPFTGQCRQDVVWPYLGASVLTLQCPPGSHSNSAGAVSNNEMH